MTAILDVLYRIIYYLVYGWRLRALESAKTVSIGRHQKLKALRQAKIAYITKGCSPCAACNAPPIGLIQPRPHGNVYEIGCSRCRGRKAFGHNRRTAVLCWNTGIFHR